LSDRVSETGGGTQRRVSLVPRGWLALAFAIALTGCYVKTDVQEPRYFELAFPAAGDVAEVPVQVVDMTGSIVGAEIDLRNLPVVAPGDTFMESVLGQPNAIRVGWDGGTCDQRADLELRQGASGPTFTLKLLPGSDDCRFVARRLIITFSQAVSATDFDLDVVR
jgi:hypothetical protein